MPDLPDWYQGFQLVGSDITIPISIDAATVAVPITLVTSYAEVFVKITAAEVTLDFNFADQSVAVFDAAKWFAHTAEQVFVSGQASIGANAGGSIATRAVPGGKTFYIAGFSWGSDGFVAISGTYGLLVLDGAPIAMKAGLRGDGIVFDVPVRALATQVVGITVGNVSGSSAGYRGGFWGWDEED